MIWQSHLKNGITEDQFQWDFTTRGVTLDLKSKTTAYIVSKSDGIWVCEGLQAELVSLCHLMNWQIQFKVLKNNGSSFQKGERLMELRGVASQILVLERPLLNLLQYSGGIATQTRALVQRIQSKFNTWPKKAMDQSQNQDPIFFRSFKVCPKLTMTRKTLPGYRDLAMISVLAGGGHLHRPSLSSGILVKENHIEVAGSILKAVDGILDVAPHGLKVEVEVKNQIELKKCLQNSKIDGVLLDNFSPKQVEDALLLIKKQKSLRPFFVEVSGGITLQNIADYVLPGVSIISCGSITHSVKGVDLSLLCLN